MYSEESRNQIKKHRDQIKKHQSQIKDIKAQELGIDGIKVANSEMNLTVGSRNDYGLIDSKVPVFNFKMKLNCSQPLTSKVLRNMFKNSNLSKLIFNEINNALNEFNQEIEKIREEVDETRRGFVTLSKFNGILFLQIDDNDQEQKTIVGKWRPSYSDNYQKQFEKTKLSIIEK